MRVYFFAILCGVGTFALAGAEDDKKWAWSDNSRKADTSVDNKKSAARYEVFEDDYPYNSVPGDYGPNYQNHRPTYGGRPQYGNRPTFENVNNRPLYGNRPNRPSFIPNQRPGGVYSPDHGFGVDSSQGVLTGPIPSWVKEGPFKNYDKCKCTEKFNCNSPGISYGHCDVGKQYCCYATNKRDQIGSLPPSRPVHSLQNGVLVGPDGPHDGPGRPGRFPRPGGGLYKPNSGLNGGSQYGVLVGPGGPFDRPGSNYNHRPSHF